MHVGDAQGRVDPIARQDLCREHPARRLSSVRLEQDELHGFPSHASAKQLLRRQLGRPECELGLVRESVTLRLVVTVVSRQFDETVDISGIDEMVSEMAERVFAAGYIPDPAEGQ